MVRHNDMLIQFNKMIIRFLNMTNCIFDNLPYIGKQNHVFFITIDFYTVLIHISK